MKLFSSDAYYTTGLHLMFYVKINYFNKEADIYFNLKAFMNSLHPTCCLFKTMIVACYPIWIIETPQQ